MLASKLPSFPVNFRFNDVLPCTIKYIIVNKVRYRITAGMSLALQPSSGLHEPPDLNYPVKRG